MEAFAGHIVLRHCERSEAIHGTANEEMDCFVACAPRNDGIKYPWERKQKMKSTPFRSHRPCRRHQPARAAASAAPRPSLLAKNSAPRLVISSRKVDACQEVAEAIRKGGWRRPRHPLQTSSRPRGSRSADQGRDPALRQDRHPGLQRGGQSLLRPRCSTSRTRPLRQDHGQVERQEQHLAVFRWRSRRWPSAATVRVVIISSIGGLRGSTVIGRLRNFESRGFCAVPQPRRRMGAEGRCASIASRRGLVKTDFARAPCGKTKSA